jgi:hypothetical protein
MGCLPTLTQRQTGRRVSEAPVRSRLLMLERVKESAADPEAGGQNGAEWGASSAAAKIYSNDALFGPIPVGFRGVQPLIAEYGVLTWRASLYARHVFGLASILHAVNRPLIREVGMACNTPTLGYPDWSFTDPTATSIWRTIR